jgi:hypothetical protein
VSGWGAGYPGVPSDAAEKARKAKAAQSADAEPADAQVADVQAADAQAVDGDAERENEGGAGDPPEGPGG